MRRETMVLYHVPSEHSLDSYGERPTKHATMDNPGFDLFFLALNVTGRGNYFSIVTALST